MAKHTLLDLAPRVFNHFQHHLNIVFLRFRAFYSDWFWIIVTFLLAKIRKKRLQFLTLFFNFHFLKEKTPAIARLKHDVFKSRRILFLVKPKNIYWVSKVGSLRDFVWEKRKLLMDLLMNFWISARQISNLNDENIHLEIIWFYWCLNMLFVHFRIL